MDSHEAKETYTAGQLAERAGVSTRTLRHYEDMGLLNPERADNGYRVYGSNDVRRLGHVLAMRACGLPLSTIGTLLKDPQADVRCVLSDHLESLRVRGRQLEEAMGRTQAAIEAIERMDSMDDTARFEQMKAQAVQANEERYGKEARQRHGETAVDAANQNLLSMSQDEWDAKEALEESIKVQLRLAMANGDVHGADARELAHMHERWIRMHWGSGAYSPQAHRGLARGYLADPRFRDYYDAAAGNGATEFLVDALLANLPES